MIRKQYRKSAYVTVNAARSVKQKHLGLELEEIHRNIGQQDQKHSESKHND